jgi:hypothetical protein
MSTLTRTDLARIMGNLSYRLKLLAQTRRSTDRLLATRFNIFDYLEPDENFLSDLIHDLLEVDGRHGQGDAFLKAFITTMCPATAPWKFQSLEREEKTGLIASHQRRMDVLIDLGEFGIALENKPWAEDGKDQIHDYVAHLDRRFAGKFAIIYLSRDGGKPTSIRADRGERLIKEKKLVLAAYCGLFRDWLECCYRLCAAEKIRWFLTDFITYVEQEFDPVDSTRPGCSHG